MRNYKFKNQPNLFLIGAMRAGSTSLHLLLGQHPDVFMSRVKEPGFYMAEAMRRELEKDDIDKEMAELLSTFIENKKYAQASAYDMLFASMQHKKYIGESSHYIYFPQAARVIHEDCPNARIIVSLRNPVERLYSEYLYYCRLDSISKKKFNEFCREGCRFDKNNRLLEMGRSKLSKGFYFTSLMEWVNVFGHDQVKIIIFDDFACDYLKVCQSVFSWLAIDPAFVPINVHSQQGGMPKDRDVFNRVENFSVVKKALKKILSRVARERLRSVWYHSSLKRGEMDPQTREFLKDVYREDIKKLEKEFQLNLNAWK